MRQPRWSSASLLLYAGGAIVLAAAVEALIRLSADYSDAGFAGWSVLFFAVLVVCSLVLLRLGSWIAGGVFAFLAVLAWGLLVGALERWLGWLGNQKSPFGGFHAGTLVLVVLLAAASLAALRRLRFPLLVVPAIAGLWYLVTDLISGGGNWSAVVTLLVGLVLFVRAQSLDAVGDRPDAFWLHVAAGVAVGGALVWFWHKDDLDWSLVALAGLAFIGVAAGVRRSSYAVLGAYGLYLAATHFATEWSHSEYSTLAYLPILLLSPFTFGFSVDVGPHGHAYAAPLTFAFLGFLLVVVGLVLERRAS